MRLSYDAIDLGGSDVSLGIAYKPFFAGIRGVQLQNDIVNNLCSHFLPAAVSATVFILNLWVSVLVSVWI